jgi:hypothetical protein
MQGRIPSVGITTNVSVVLVADLHFYLLTEVAKGTVLYIQRTNSNGDVVSAQYLRTGN